MFHFKTLVSNVVPVSAAICLSMLCTTSSAEAAQRVAPGHSFTGYSHHYGDKFHGRRTASGQRHDKFKLSAAHRSLPFGTHLLVKNTRNGKSCIVLVNDRGPFGSPSLVLDVSKAAAHKLGFPGGGKIPIVCQVLDAKAGAQALKSMEAGIEQPKELLQVIANTPPAPKQIAIAAKPPAPKPNAVAAEKPVAEPEVTGGTFLLVINEAIEADKHMSSHVKKADYNPSLPSHFKTAEYSPSHANNQNAYAPTVFMKVEEGAAKQEAGPHKEIAEKRGELLL